MGLRGICVCCLTAVFLLWSELPLEAKRNRLDLKSEAVRVDKPRSRKRKIRVEEDSVEFVQLRKGIVFSGYDKTASSSHERWFVSNNTPVGLHSFSVEISYYSSDGRLLHRREVPVSCTVPPGETRMVEVRSFDRQKNFYYLKSAAPRRGGIPFDVKIRLLSVTADN